MNKQIKKQGYGRFFFKYIINEPYTLKIHFNLFSLKKLRHFQINNKKL